MRDRLSELKRGTYAPNAPVRTPSILSVESGIDTRSVDSHQMFFSHVDELKASLDDLQRRIQMVQVQQATILNQPVVQPQEKMRLENMMDEVRIYIRRLKPRIRQIEDDIKADEQAGGEAFRARAQYRIRKNQFERLKTMLHTLMATFNQVQVEYKSRVSKRVKRHLNMAGQPLSAREVDNMLDSTAEDTFFRQLRPVTVEAQMAVEDAANRHRELIEMERNITELQEILEDLQELAQSQEPMIDSIATNVLNARDYNEAAIVNMRRAVKSKKVANQKRFWIFAIVIFMFMILAMVCIILGFTIHK